MYCRSLVVPVALLTLVLTVSLTAGSVKAAAPAPGAEEDPLADFESDGVLETEAGTDQYRVRLSYPREADL
mgnify:CR=1 FL=1